MPTTVVDLTDTAWTAVYANASASTVVVTLDPSHANLFVLRTGTSLPLADIDAGIRYTAYKQPLFTASVLPGETLYMRHCSPPYMPREPSGSVTVMA